MNFKFKDKVRICSGFYEGMIGTVKHEFNFFPFKEYIVIFETDPYVRTFKQKELELLNEHPEQN